MTVLRFHLALLLGFLLSGCNPTATVKAPPPEEVSGAAVGHFCGMNLTEHPGPKGQIFLIGRAKPEWFSSVHDTIAFTRLPEEAKEIAAIYVNDMGRAGNWDQPEPGTWIEARSAWFVIGSGRQSGMGGREAVPFGDAAAARTFAAAEGGQVVRWSEIPNAYVLGGDEPPPPAARP
jgi:copper chaperone NosL